MLKANSILIPIFFLAILLAGVPVSVSASESKTETINKLLEQIGNLQLIVKDRFDFNRTSIITEPAEDRSSDFFLRVAGDSAPTLYAEKSVNLILETDSGVRQILIMTDCRDNELSPIFNNNTTCESQTWVYGADLQDGIKTFTLPVQVSATENSGEVGFRIFACRFDGCVLETELDLPFKTDVEFTDLVKIYDRYEWTYEWDDKIYHVQEVLLSFPHKDIQKVNLVVRCDGGGLSIATTEKNRVTCGGKRRYSNLYYRNEETDEVGNTYNLKIESVTKNISVEQSGSVEMEFTFTDKRNQVVSTIYYRPVQKEEILEEN